MIQNTKTVSARKNNFPPSLLVSIPMMKTCEAMAPIIVKNPKIAPQKVVFGFRINIAVMSSKTPEKIRPYGSA